MPRIRRPNRPRLASLTALVAAATLCAGWAGPAASATSIATGPTVYRFGVVGNRGALTQLQLDRPTPVHGINGRVVSVATSNSDGYALTSAGTVWAWGVASDGELGDGTHPAYVTRAVEVAFPAGVRIVALADPMPFDGALAIDSHGNVWGWGLNALGDLCLSGLVVLTPQELPLHHVTLATGARTHALFATGDAVYACGSGEDGVLGTGSTSGSTTPVPVVGLPAQVRVKALTSSWEGSGALLANGHYYDWGYNAAGQLGDGSTTDSDVPVQVSLPGAVRQVFQGGSGATNGQTVVLLQDGSAWSWGNGARGQLGDGSRVSSDIPVAIDVPRGVRFVAVSSGGFASYAVDGSGRLWAWGYNKSGQLGTGGVPLLSTRPLRVGIRVDAVTSTAQDVAGLGR